MNLSLNRALNGRPLYVGRDEVGDAREVIRRFGLSGGSCLTHLQWREGYQKLFPCPVPLSYTGVALKMAAFSRLVRWETFFEFSAAAL